MVFSREAILSLGWRGYWRSCLPAHGSASLQKGHTRVPSRLCPLQGNSLKNDMSHMRAYTVSLALKWTCHHTGRWHISAPHLPLMEHEGSRPAESDASVFKKELRQASVGMRPHSDN